MALPDYQRRKVGLVRNLAEAVARLLGLVSGRPLSEQQFRDLSATLTEAVNAPRSQLAGAAFELYLEMRPDEADPFGPAPNLNPVPETYFERVLTTHRADLESRDNTQAAITRVTQSAVGMAEDGGREMIQATTRIDTDVAAGWARVLTGEESCGFCAMLASRGAVYSSREGALYKSNKAKTYQGAKNDEWHLGCDCIAVPVFRGHETSWPGYAESQRLEKLWADKTRGKGGKDALREFKRVFAHEDVRPYSPLTSTE